MSASELTFNDRVVVVTGGARGIGLAHCRLLAARGARVVVNDLGSAMDGAGSDAGPAAEAVEEIVGLGGRAIADTADISSENGAAALIEHAIDAYGAIDALVHNAGIFTTDTFPDVDPGVFEQQLAVHVGGAFHTARAAWPHLAKHRRGRVVLTASSGALGSATLAAYGTAKMAVLGLGRSLAVSGRPMGTKVNVVAPMAMTRMMAAGMTTRTDEDASRHDRSPELVSPLVALLCHDLCPTTGEFFNAGMHRYSRFAIVENNGFFPPAGPVEPEQLLAEWDSVMDLGNPRVIENIVDWAAVHFGLLDQQGDLEPDR